jgi:ferredoxin
MHLHIDLDQCDGHGRCELVDAELFPLDDDGFAARSETPVPAGSEALAAAGVAACPMSAIRLLED